MKTKMIVTGLCLCLSACGNNRSAPVVQESKTASPVIPVVQAIPAVPAISYGNLDLKNLSPQSYNQARLSFAGAKYYDLGTFDVGQLPTALMALDSGTQIGTLTTVNQDETYSSQYESLVEPVYSERMFDTKRPVYLIKNSKNTSQVILALEDDGQSGSIKVDELPIEIKSSPREYCSRIQVYETHITNSQCGYPTQVASCDADGNCNALVHCGEQSNSNVSHSLSIGYARHSCLGNDIHYDVTETKTNRSTPKSAIVQVSSDYSKIVNQLKFDL